jgi:type IV secretory pathway VirB2 component (pilin)
MDMTPNAPAVVNAINWLEQLLLGSTAVAVGTIAVCTMGFMLFTGRIEFRRGVHIILGCFVLFGAASIASGILAALRANAYTSAEVEPPPPIDPPVASKPASPPTRQGYDPYAGAAVMPK